MTAVSPSLAAWDRHASHGHVTQRRTAGRKPGKRCDAEDARRAAGHGLRRIAVDLDEFRTTGHLDAVIVINVASSEPIATRAPRGLSSLELLQLLEHADRSPVPASVLYAVAASNRAARISTSRRRSGPTSRCSRSWPCKPGRCTWVETDALISLPSAC